MNAIERSASRAMRHLQEARLEMRKLLYVSQDGINQIVLDDSFEQLEEDCREFLKCRFFIPESKPRQSLKSRR